MHKSVQDPAGFAARPSDADSVSQRETRLGLVVLLIVFFVTSSLWAIIVPVPAQSPNAPAWGGYNPDEQVHMRYIEYLATHHALPTFHAFVPAIDSIYTVIHPPLYYVFGALFYSLLAPFLGYGGTLFFLRFVTCFFGTGLVYLTYRTAKLLLPPSIALLAAVFTAGVPMFVSLSAAVSNEIPCAFFSAGALYVTVAGLRYGFSRRRVYALAAWCAVGVGVKMTCIALLPVALLAVWLRGRSHPGAERARNPLLPSLLLITASPFVLNGWWFLRNTLMYGDPLMARIHAVHWNTSAKLRPWWKDMSLFAFFWDTSSVGWESFWGIFDAFSQPLTEGSYPVLFGIELLAGIGLVRFARRGGFRSPVRRNATFCLTLFFLLIWVIFWATNARVYAPQGRYLLPTLLPLGLTLAVGWRALVGRRFWMAAVGVLTAILMTLNILALAETITRPDRAKDFARSGAGVQVAYETPTPSLACEGGGGRCENVGME